MVGIQLLLGSFHWLAFRWSAFRHAPIKALKVLYTKDHVQQYQTYQ